MKILKNILIVVGLLVTVFLLIAMLAPKTYHVERKITIDVPEELLFDHIKNLKKMKEWSPWSDYDKNMKVEYTGKDGEIGSASTWEGNDDVGKGRQEVVSVKYDHVELKVNFEEPFEAECKSLFHFYLSPYGVEVTWSFDGENPFPWNVMAAFYNMDSTLGKDFEKGLKRLKEMTEKLAIELKKPKIYRGYEIRKRYYKPKLFISKKGTVKFEDIGNFYEKNLPAIFKAIGKAKLELAGSPSGLFFKWDEKTKTAEMAAAIPVKFNINLKVKGYESIIVKGNAIHIAYMGAYEKSENAHLAMDDYMKEKNLKQGDIVVEEYVTDPKKEPDTTKWLTNISYILKPDTLY